MSLLIFLKFGSRITEEVANQFKQCELESEAIKLNAGNVFKRLFCGTQNKNSSELVNTTEKIQKVNDLDYEIKKIKSLNTLLNKVSKTGECLIEDFKMEFDLFAQTGQTSKIFLCFRTIPGTSIESDGVFSALGLFLTKNRSRIKAEVLKNIIVLRSYYQKQNEK